MSVVVNELEVVPATPPSASQGMRGGGGSEGGGQNGAGASADAAMTMALLRREMSRLARLWAD